MCKAYVQVMIPLCNSEIFCHHNKIIIKKKWQASFLFQYRCILKPLFNTVHCKMVSDLVWFAGGPQNFVFKQKHVDYIER